MGIPEATRVRLDGQIAWMGAKGARYQRACRTPKTAELRCAAGIPFLQAVHRTGRVAFQDEPRASDDDAVS